MISIHDVRASLPPVDESERADALLDEASFDALAPAPDSEMLANESNVAKNQFAAAGAGPANTNPAVFAYPLAVHALTPETVARRLSADQSGPDSEDRYQRSLAAIEDKLKELRGV